MLSGLMMKTGCCYFISTAAVSAVIDDPFLD